MRWSGAKTENRLAGRGAGRALPAAGAGRARTRRHPYPHRAYPRRSGRDAVDAAVARQRHRRPCGDGAARASATACVLARPLLDVPKSRLIATLNKARIGFADDPTNRDPAFHAAAAARADAGARGRRRRCARAGAARVAAGARQRRGRNAGRWRRALSRAQEQRGSGLPEVTPRPSMQRPLPRCRRKSGFGCSSAPIDRFGHEGPAELGKVEALLAALDRAVARECRGARPKDRPGRLKQTLERTLRQTLAGALVSHARGRIRVEPATAPPHRREAGFAVMVHPEP